MARKIIKKMELLDLMVSLIFAHPINKIYLQEQVKKEESDRYNNQT